MRRMCGIVAGTALATVGLGLAACQPIGSANSGASGAPTTTASAGAADAQAVAAAYPTTVATGSARIAIAGQVGAGSVGMPITSTGVIDFSGRSADLMQQLPGGQGNAEARFVGGVLYERLPAALASRISGGKPWLALNLAALSQQNNGAVRQLLTGSPADPSMILAYLRGAGDRVTRNGPDTVDGTPTTRYTVLIDLDKSVAGQGSQAQNAVHALEQQLGSHTLPAQVWLDQQGRISKLSVDTTTAGATPGTTTPANGNVTFRFSATLSDYGVITHITTPPPDQTTDVTNLLNGNH